MGPPGLWAELRRVGAPYKDLQGQAVEKLLEGKVVAIDVAIWLYEAQQQPELVKHFGAVGASLKVVFERCVRLLRKGILPVVVLEGQNGGRASRVTTQGRGGLGKTFAAQARLRSLLHSLGVPYIDADGEAEATCAAISLANACEFVASNDFDALLFGARTVLKDMNVASDDSSACEVWDIDALDRICGLDRRALIAAAFLVGSDYDCRNLLTPGSNLASQEEVLASQDREGAGVSKIGARQAVSMAKELRIIGKGDALAALESITRGVGNEDTPASQIARVKTRCTGCRRCGHGNVAKKEHGKRGCQACGTRSGCLPRMESGGVCECDHCRSVRQAGGEAKVQSARILHKASVATRLEPGCLAGFHAVVEQYSNRIPIASASSFLWAGHQHSALQASLRGVFSIEALPSKMQPLDFEWTLRRLANECPADVCKTLNTRQQWTLSEGLPYVPVNAKCSYGANGDPSYALVEWANASDCSPMPLPARLRRSRVGLARACGLLECDAVRPPALRAAFSRLLGECPRDVRESKDTFVAWGFANQFNVVPDGGRRLRSGRVQLTWCTSQTSVRRDDAKLVVPFENVETFGGFLLRDFQKMGGRSPVGQKQLTSFFTLIKRTGSHVCEKPPSDSTLQASARKSCKTKRGTTKHVPSKTNDDGLAFPGADHLRVDKPFTGSDAPEPALPSPPLPAQPTTTPPLSLEEISAHEGGKFKQALLQANLEAGGDIGLLVEHNQSLSHISRVVIGAAANEGSSSSRMIPQFPDDCPSTPRRKAKSLADDMQEDRVTPIKRRIFASGVLQYDYPSTPRRKAKSLAEDMQEDRVTPIKRRRRFASGVLQSPADGKNILNARLVVGQVDSQQGDDS